MKSKKQLKAQTTQTYNCAHLRLTKESPTFEYFDTGRYWLILGQYRGRHQLEIKRFLSGIARISETPPP